MWLLPLLPWLPKLAVRGSSRGGGKGEGTHTYIFAQCRLSTRARLVTEIGRGVVYDRVGRLGFRETCHRRRTGILLAWRGCCGTAVKIKKRAGLGLPRGCASCLCNDDDRPAQPICQFSQTDSQTDSQTGCWCHGAEEVQTVPAEPGIGKGNGRSASPLSVAS